jgi:hypothetical protein
MRTLARAFDDDIIGQEITYTTDDLGIMSSFMKGDGDDE